MAFLKVADLCVNYGVIKAVRGVSFEVGKGEIVSLIGANGAGKSSIMNTLAGLVRPASGKISFEDKNITEAPAYAMVKKGVVLCPEGRRIFPRFTVLENLKVGGYVSTQEQVEKGIEQAVELFPILKERISQVAGTLSGGEQQMLAVARAIMNEPKLLMLDEPSLGLAPIVVQELFEKLVQINRSGTTILLVEQNASMALEISNRGYVVENGRIVIDGSGAALISNEKVVQAYFGGF